MPKRTVLVPVDGTDFSYRIFPVLIGLLNGAEHEVVLLTVRDRISGHVSGPARPVAADPRLQSYETARDFEYAAHPIYASQERDSALADFRAAAQEHAEVLDKAGFSVEYEMRFGEPIEEISAYVEANQVDLIAMATHWRTGLDRLVNGNTLTGILPRVDVPLLVIRLDEE